MMLKSILAFNLLLILSLGNILASNLKNNNFDVTAVGYVLVADGIGKKIVNFIDYFKDKLKINYIETWPSNYDYVDDSVLNIIQDGDKTPGNVAILFNPVFDDHVSYLPKESIIKVALSVFESTQIPDVWVYNINKYFDAVVVPSPFLIEVYKRSGVKVPIFLLQEGEFLDEFLNNPIKKVKNKPFVFGMSAGLWPRKNHELLIKSFLNKFGGNNDVQLKIHGRPGCEKTKASLENFMREHKPNNIKLILRSINPNKYFKFMSSLDVYVMISKAEGFSWTPRQSIALGIPTILSNNTAHESMCQTPYFIPVKSDILEPADYTWIIGKVQGYNFNMLQSDLEEALEKVYNNYDYYLKRANKGREWARQFTYKNLEKKYLNLIKPNNIILGPKNIITNDYIMTNSKALYDKYILIKSLNN